MARQREEHDERRLEDALRTAAQEWRTTFDAISDAVALLDAEGSVVRCNLAMTRLLGRPFGDIIGRACWELLFDSPEPPQDCPFWRMTETGAKQTAISSVGDRWYEVTVDPVWNPDGNLDGGVFVVGDITERQRSGEALRQSEERYRSLVETAPEIIYTLSLPDGYLTSLNPAFEAITGWSRSEWLGRSFAGLIHPEDLSPAMDNFRLAASGEVAPAHELRVRAKSGEYVVSEFVTAPQIEGGKVVEVFGIARDITERKRVEGSLEAAARHLRSVIKGLVQALAAAVELRDRFTSGHQWRVAELSSAIAEEMGLPEEQIEGLYIAASIHDVGKLYVPAEILSKPGQLSEIEFSIIKVHPQLGYDILKGVEFPWPVAQVVLQHHERMDGSGYPQGLRGGDILLEARILGVADVVEAMSSHRPYRPALGAEAALHEIWQNRGVLYDADVVDACMTVFTERGFRFE